MTVENSTGSLSALLQQNAFEVTACQRVQRPAQPVDQAELTHACIDTRCPKYRTRPFFASGTEYLRSDVIWSNSRTGVLLEANEKLMDGEGTGCVCVCVSALTLSERQYNSAFVRHARYFTVLSICSNSFPTHHPPLDQPRRRPGMPDAWRWIPLSIFSLAWPPSPVAPSDVSSPASGPFSWLYPQNMFNIFPLTPSLS